MFIGNRVEIYENINTVPFNFEAGFGGREKRMDGQSRQERDVCRANRRPSCQNGILGVAPTELLSFTRFDSYKYFASTRLRVAPLGAKYL